MNRLNEIAARLAAIATEIDTATGEALAALNTETDNLIAERSALMAEVDIQQQIRSKVASGALGTPASLAPAQPSVEERAARAFVESRQMVIGTDETRAAILTTGNLAIPTEVSGINDHADNKVSSIVDMVRVVNCEGMGTNRVAYEDTVIDAAADQTEGSAATEKEPTFNYVDITPTSIAVVSKISKQAKKQTPLNYSAKVKGASVTALRKKAAVLLSTALKSSTLNNSVAATLDASSKGVIDEKTLRKLVLSHGGDEGINGGVLFLNKTDLLAFGDVRGTNEKAGVYEITPDGSNPNVGTIKDGGLTVRYCICSGLTACSGTAQAASTGADKPTMIYGDPMALELDLFSGYTVRVSEDYAITSLMDTIVGDAEIGAGVVQKHGFTALVIKKASA